MFSKKGILKLILLALLIGLFYFLTFTPWGVHTMGETLFGGFESYKYEADDYPTGIDEVKSISKTISLPIGVEQPSGIDYDPMNKTFFIVTDQAEIMELSHDLQKVNSSIVMSKRPLLFRQGTVESADFYEERLFVGGDLGSIEIWDKMGGVWERADAINPQKNNQVNIEAEALAINPTNGDIYIGKEDAVTVIDTEGKYISDFKLTIKPKTGRSSNEYLIAGMDFFDGKLYVLTEYHSAILIVDPSTENVESVYALEGITEGAGLTVTKDSYYVVVDHELNEPSPGVKVYLRQ